MPWLKNQVVFKQLLRINGGVAVGQDALIVIDRLTVEAMGNQFTANPAVEMIALLTNGLLKVGNQPVADRLAGNAIHL